MLLPALGWLPWLVANGGEIIRTRRLLRLLREAGGLPREGNSQQLLLCIILVGEGLEKVDLEGEDLVVGVDSPTLTQNNEDTETLLIMIEATVQLEDL